MGISEIFGLLDIGNATKEGKDTRILVNDYGQPAQYLG
jgi:hypothetical protein